MSDHIFMIIGKFVVFFVPLVIVIGFSAWGLDIRYDINEMKDKIKELERKSGEL